MWQVKNFKFFSKFKGRNHYRAKLYKGLRRISRSLKGIEKRVSYFRFYEFLKFFILFFLK